MRVAVRVAMPVVMAMGVATGMDVVVMRVRAHERNNIT